MINYSLIIKICRVMSTFCLQNSFKIRGIDGINRKFIQDMLLFELERHNI